MHLSFPKCLMMAEASKMCPEPAPMSHGGVWLAWFLSDDTLGYSLRGGWMVVTRSLRPRTGLFCVRHRVFQQVLWTQKVLCLLEVCAVFRDLVATAGSCPCVNNWMTRSSEALGTTATSMPSLELSLADCDQGGRENTSGAEGGDWGQSSGPQ